eukprot:9907297-Ditylum_brightwellii.AAC.1
MTEHPLTGNPRLQSISNLADMLNTHSNLVDMLNTHCITNLLFEQIDNIHYQSHDLFAPVAYDMRIIIIMVLIIVASWETALLNTKGEFLSRRFKNDEQLYMAVP